VIVQAACAGTPVSAAGPIAVNRTGAAAPPCMEAFVMRSLVTLVRRLLPFAAVFFVAVALGTGASAQELVEGKQYIRLRNPMPVDTGKKIEVIEFFSYGCPHCADLEPILDKWLTTLPPDVQFMRVPVVFQERWVPLAKIYYTLDALGVESKLSPEVFAAIHKNGVNLASTKTFFDWAAGKWLDRKKVEDMYNSFAIAGRMNRALQEAKQYNIQSVPTIVVDGKFITATDKVGSHEALPPAIDALIAKARAERPKS
jgi:thiol:disulfide interchange protein DsbA